MNDTLLRELLLDVISNADVWKSAIKVAAAVDIEENQAGYKHEEAVIERLREQAKILLSSR